MSTRIWNWRSLTVMLEAVIKLTTWKILWTSTFSQAFQYINRMINNGHVWTLHNHDTQPCGLFLISDVYIFMQNNYWMVTLYHLHPLAFVLKFKWCMWMTKNVCKLHAWPWYQLFIVHNYREQSYSQGLFINRFSSKPPQKN